MSAGMSLPVSLNFAALLITLRRLQKVDVSEKHRVGTATWQPLPPNGAQQRDLRDRNALYES